MKKDQLSKLLAKYLDGSGNPEEIEAIDKWYEKYRDEPDFTSQLTLEDQLMLKSKILGKLQAQIAAEPKKPVIKSNLLRWWISAAAVLLVLFAGSLLVYKYNQESPDATELFTVNRSKTIIKQLLPDSSIVWLQPNARVSWPKKFAGSSRKLTMEGDCFFEITKNPDRPFIISSEHIITKVWGTSFRVIDGRTTAARVTVLSGKVSVSHKSGAEAEIDEKLSQGETMLYPNQQVVLSGTNLIVSKKVDVSELSLYKHLNLSFTNAELTEIVKVLSEKFNVNIKISDTELEKKHMTADLTDLNLPEVMEVLKVAMRVDYELSGQTILLKTK